MALVFEKLNLKGQKEILVLNAPGSFEPELTRLSGIIVHRNINEMAEITFALAFVTSQKEVETIAPTVAVKTKGDVTLWFAYPKQTSKRYRCDFNRDSGWSSLGAAGFECVRLVAIDEDWSAMRFRRVEFIKLMRRDPKRAQSFLGKRKIAGQ